MRLRDLARVVVDGRNLSIAAEVGSHVRDILHDGRITPEEVVDAAHGAVDVVLDEYGMSGRTVYRQNDEHAAVKDAIEDAIERVDNALTQALLDKQITYAELNDLMKEVASAVLEAMDPPFTVTPGPPRGSEG